MDFKNQKEIWTHLVNGGSVYQDKIEIKFVDGAVKAHMNNTWHFCPISFENPRLFRGER